MTIEEQFVQAKERVTPAPLSLDNWMTLLCWVLGETEAQLGSR